ncbi:vancomycin high temperature exclusion protein, partial [Escherichia coli]|nr:vancomycin high temperature exclusion protein [Escherichia coli]
QLREKLARVSAVIDAKILHRQPKYLGPLVMIGPFSEHGCPAKE